jgi:iron complex transport system ATP-binding protein
VVAQGLIGDTITAENLSKTFALPLVLERVGERFAARAA